MTVEEKGSAHENKLKGLGKDSEVQMGNLARHEAFFLRDTKTSGLKSIKGKITLCKVMSRIFRNIVKFMKLLTLVCLKLPKVEPVFL